jgi:hypothetical protein
MSRTSNLRIGILLDYNVSNACFNHTRLVNLTFAWNQVLPANFSTSPLVIGNQSINVGQVAQELISIAQPRLSELSLPAMTLLANRTYGAFLMSHWH